MALARTVEVDAGLLQLNRNSVYFVLVLRLLAGEVLRVRFLILVQLVHELL